MDDRSCAALSEKFSRRGGGRPRGRGDDSTQDMPGQASRTKEPLEWSAISTICLRKIRRWRVPPHWSNRDWFEEMGAEATMAGLQATRDFDPTRGVPWEAFLRQRVMRSALARYRREWTYGPGAT